MNQLRFTTSNPQMFCLSGKELVDPKDTGDLIVGSLNGYFAYIDGDAEELAGYDIPIFIDGHMEQLDLPEKDQDILMMLPSGEYKCRAVRHYGQYLPHGEGGYLIRLEVEE